MSEFPSSGARGAFRLPKASGDSLWRGLWALVSGLWPRGLWALVSAAPRGALSLVSGPRTTHYWSWAAPGNSRRAGAVDAPSRTGPSPGGPWTRAALWTRAAV